MKAQIRVKTRNRERDWAVFHPPDEKKRLPRVSSGSWLEMLLEHQLEYMTMAYRGMCWYDLIGYLSLLKFEFSFLLSVF
jgi:hypothetical protein